MSGETFEHEAEPAGSKIEDVAGALPPAETGGQGTTLFCSHRGAIERPSDAMTLLSTLLVITNGENVCL